MKGVAIATLAALMVSVASVLVFLESILVQKVPSLLLDSQGRPIKTDSTFGDAKSV